MDDQNATVHISNFNVEAGEKVDLSHILHAGDTISDYIVLGGSGAPHSDLHITSGGSDHLVASLTGVEASIPELMSNLDGQNANQSSGHSAANSWTDVVEISSQTGAPLISGPNGEHISGPAHNPSWTVQVVEGTASIKGGDLVFGDGASHSGHVVITTADHQTHELHNVDKISWHS